VLTALALSHSNLEMVLIKFERRSFAVVDLHSLVCMPLEAAITECSVSKYGQIFATHGESMNR